MSQPFPFKAVIFDMDGVIVDTEAAYVSELIEVFGEHELDITREEVYSLVGSSTKVFRSRLASWFGRNGLGPFTPEGAVDEFNRWTADRIYDYGALLNPGVPETLAKLHSLGVRVALASSSPMDNIQDVLEQCGIADAFEIIVSGEQFHESKPHPEIYLHAVERLGLDPWDCCCVEDSVYGIEAGRRAGLTVIAKREERFGFSQDGADLFIDEIPDLLRVERP